MHEQDTICAVATAPGEGGIGIIRVSGEASIELVSRIFRPAKTGSGALGTTHVLRYGHVIDPASGEIIDEALTSVMRAPSTYTREDVVEINCHGGMTPLRRTMELLISAGARQAEPGEFTRRAFLNGRIDLVQAEAVLDVIRAKTDLARRAANEQLQGGLSAEICALRDALVTIIASVEAGIDFPEEDLETSDQATLLNDVVRVLAGIDELLSSASSGRILRDGFATALVGRPNVGKSSLLNALLKQDRAIVTEVPGTTRDVLEEYLNIDGIPLRILDTAGIRHTPDTVEREGVRRAVAAIRGADLVLVVLDGSQPLSQEDRQVIESVENKSAVWVINKSDLPQKLEMSAGPSTPVPLSCLTGAGLDHLRRTIADKVRNESAPTREHAWAVNLRHETALRQARQSLEKAIESIEADLSSEFTAMDLRGALDSLGHIVGATYTDDILNRVFSEFCIGK